MNPITGKTSIESIVLDEESFFVTLDDYIITEGVSFNLSWQINSSLNLTYYYFLDEDSFGTFNTSSDLITINYPNSGSQASLGVHQVILHVSDPNNVTMSDSVIVTIIKGFTNRDDFVPYSNTATTDPEDFPLNPFGLIIGLYFLRIATHRKIIGRKK